MRSKTVLALVALNVALLASLCFRNVFTHTAQAAPAAKPSEYLMVPGDINGGNAGVIFILDTRNGWLSARTLTGEGNKPRMVDMQALDLNRIFTGAAAAAH
ncbi:MAG: hypothetical protein JWO87_565 [Phycisphaerales bacterium]|jgi:hypothetical protein|nr:hypothetical protein [Phycisphaerales bacterium]MDB5305250.1 hypothetical protein [Phycisphaerales bacterium]